MKVMKIEDCLVDLQTPKYLHHMDNALTSLVPEPLITELKKI